MSTYELSDSGLDQLVQTRDVVRLFKSASQQADDGGVVETALLASYLVLIDEQLSRVIEGVEG